MIFKSCQEKFIQRLIPILRNRLWEINDTLNFAYKNKEEHLPYNAYKNLCNERQAIREVLYIN